jgi:integrase
MQIERHKNKWRGVVHHQGRRYRTGGYTDKRAAEAAAGKLLVNLERGGEGLRDKYAKVMAAPIADHLAAYLADMRACGSGVAWIASCRQRLERMLANMAITCWAELTPAKLLAWRDGPHPIMQGTKDGPETTTRMAGPETINQCRRVLLAFVRWAAKHDRCKPDMPLELAKVNRLAVKDTDKRRERRALTVKESGDLLAKVPDDHRLFYRLALLTGLRVGEVKALQWRDVILDREPRLELRADSTKAGRADVIPLHGELADELRQRQGMPMARVCPDVPTLDQHKAYLTAAGIAFVDDTGRRLDLHSLRHSFISNLAAAGVHPKTAQRLARHSTMELTMKRYTHLGLSDMAGALERLTMPTATPDPMQATGTGDISSHPDHDGGERGAYRGRNTVKNGTFIALPVTNGKHGNAKLVKDDEQTLANTGKALRYVAQTNPTTNRLETTGIEPATPSLQS